MSKHEPDGDTTSVLQAVLDAIKGTLDPHSQIADHPNVKFAQMQRLRWMELAPAAHQERTEPPLLTPKAARYEEVRRDVLKTILDDNDRMHAELEGTKMTEPHVEPCDVCEMGDHRALKSKQGKPLNVLCNACLDNEVRYDPRGVRVPAAHQERTEPTLTLMEFRREVHDNLCVVRDGEKNSSPVRRAMLMHECLEFLSELYQRALGAPARAAEWQPLAMIEAVNTILRGFDEGVFIRNVDGDSKPSWALKTLPYIVALSTAKRLVSLPPGALAGDSNSKK